jgi:hypothetical protein
MKEVILGAVAGIILGMVLNVLFYGEEKPSCQCRAIEDYPGVFRIYVNKQPFTVTLKREMP